MQTYKQKSNIENEKKLNNLYETHKIPSFVQTQLDFLNSANGKIQYLYTLIEFFSYLIDNEIVEAKSIGQLNDQDLATVTGNTCNKYFLDLKEKGNADSTIQTKIKKISSFYSRCVDDDELEIYRNPIKRVKKRAFSEVEKTKEKKKVNDADLKKLITNIETKTNYFFKNRDLAVVNVLIGTGLRESELAGLEMKDLYLEEKTPFIMVVRKGKQALKSKVYLSNTANEAIKKWLKERPLYANEDETAVFVNKFGLRLRELAIYDIVKSNSPTIYYLDSVTGEVKEGWITPHMLRHVYATKLAEASVYDQALIKQQLGHSSISTSEIYMHVTDESLKKLGEI